MEKLKVTHDHSLTDILKVLIFAIVLLMPFLVYAPTTLYYGFNEHATGTTTVTEGGWEVQESTSNEVNDDNDIKEGNAYTLWVIQLSEPAYADIDNFSFEFSHCDVYLNNDYYEEVLIENVNVYYTYSGANENDQMLFKIYENSNDINIIYYEDTDISFPIQIKINNISDESFNSYANQFFSETNYHFVNYEYTEEVEVQKDITQMMEKNWDDLWDTNLFKWTDTSILKNGLDNFTQAFGITNTSHINNLITYELIMVGVYIVIDIALTLFKWLTHMIGNK